MSTTNNKNIAIRLFKAVQEVDAATIDALVSPNVVDHSPMFGEPSFRPELLTRMAGELKAAFPDVRIVPEHVLAEGDRVLIVEAVEGTNTGEFRGQPPTGGTLKGRAAHLLRIDGGQVVEHWAVRDLEGLPRGGSHTSDM